MDRSWSRRRQKRTAGGYASRITSSRLLRPSVVRRIFASSSNPSWYGLRFTTAAGSTQAWTLEVRDDATAQQKRNLQQWLARSAAAQR